MSRLTPGHDTSLVESAQVTPTGSLPSALVVALARPEPEHREAGVPAAAPPEPDASQRPGLRALAAPAPPDMPGRAGGSRRRETRSLVSLLGGASSRRSSRREHGPGPEPAAGPDRLVEEPARGSGRPGAAEPGSPAAAPVERLWHEHLTGATRCTRDRLVLHYVPLVRSLAQRLVASLPAHVDLSDLAQSGVFGLIDAIDRFDPARCPRFESYAGQRIRGAMLDELRAQDWVPRTVRGRVREIERARERLEARCGRAPSDREIAAEAGLTPAELRAALRQVHLLSVEALDDFGGGAGGLSEALVDHAWPDPMTVVQHRETTRLLSAAVGQLGERDRTVIHLYYVENCTLAEIGRRLGVTESRVCQLHARLMTRLRGRLEEQAAG